MIESIQSKKKTIKSTNTRTDTQSTQHGRPWLTAVRKPSASRNRRPVSARKRPRPVGISTLVSNRASGPHHRAETATVTQLPDERPLAGPVALSEASRAHCPPGFGAARPPGFGPVRAFGSPLSNVSALFAARGMEFGRSYRFSIVRRCFWEGLRILGRSYARIGRFELVGNHFRIGRFEFSIFFL